MPPDTPAETMWVIEAECEFSLSGGNPAVEEYACATAPAQSFRFSAFTDGGNWADASGEEWMWADFPPIGTD